MNPRIEKILKLPVYQRTIILIVLLGAVIGGFVYVLYLPLQEEYHHQLAQGVSLSAKLEQDQRIATDLPKFKAEYEKMQLQLQQALTELPNQKEIPALLTSIAALAKDQGLDVLRFKPGNEISKGFYAEVPVELKLIGSFHQVAHFFQEIGELSRIVNMGNVSITIKKADEGPTLLAVDCLATTFRFLDSSAANSNVK